MWIKIRWRGSGHVTERWPARPGFKELTVYKQKENQDDNRDRVRRELHEITTGSIEEAMSSTWGN